MKPSCATIAMLPAEQVVAQSRFERAGRRDDPR
jgi:hypothetical protein